MQAFGLHQFLEIYENVAGGPTLESGIDGAPRLLNFPLFSDLPILIPTSPFIFSKEFFQPSRLFHAPLLFIIHNLENCNCNEILITHSFTLYNATSNIDFVASHRDTYSTRQDVVSTYSCTHCAAFISRIYFC